MVEHCKMVHFLLDDSHEQWMFGKGYRKKSHVIGGRMAFWMLQSSRILKIGVLEAHLAGQPVHQKHKHSDAVSLVTRIVILLHLVESTGSRILLQTAVHA